MRYLLTKTQLILMADVSERMCLKKPSYGTVSYAVLKSGLVTTLHVVSLIYQIYRYGDIENVQFCISGPCATTHVESGGFCRSRPGVEHPDIMFHFVPTQVIVIINRLINY